MKKAACALAISLVFFPASAFSFSEKMPKDKSLGAVVEFMMAECPLEKDGSFDSGKCGDDTFDFFFENGMEEWVVPFCKAFASGELEPYRYRFGYGAWHNPISIAIKKGMRDLAREIIVAAPDLVNMRDTGGQFDGAEPLRYAVQADDLELARLMVESIPDVNKVVCASDKEEWGMEYGTSNILTYAASDSMKNLLVKAGCRRLIPYGGSMRKSSVTDDNVNVRDAAGFSGRQTDLFAITIAVF